MSRDRKGRQLLASAASRECPAVGGLLDLDVPPENTRARPWRAGRLIACWQAVRTARVPGPAVVVLVIGAIVLASMATYRWQAWRDLQARRSAVLVQALVPGTNAGSGSSVVVGAARELAVHMAASLALVNGGPLPVEVTELIGDQHGLSVWTSKDSVLVRPGALTISVMVAFDCAAGFPTEPLRIAMRVRTADGRSREASSLVAVTGTPWADRLNGMCHPVPA